MTRTVISRSVGIGLGVVDLDDPVAVLVEHAGVEQLVLGVVLAAPAVLGDEVLVRERALRVVVAPPVPRVARDGVDVPPVLLGVLAVVALVAGQAEDPLLEDRVPAVPQRERRGTGAARCRRTRPGRPRPSGRRASGRGRAGSSPTPRRRRCSPRGPCPTGARSGTAPRGTSRSPAAGRPRAGRTCRPAFRSSLIVRSRTRCNAPRVRSPSWLDETSLGAEGTCGADARRGMGGSGLSVLATTMAIGTTRTIATSASGGAVDHGEFLGDLLPDHAAEDDPERDADDESDDREQRGLPGDRRPASRGPCEPEGTQDGEFLSAAAHRRRRARAATVVWRAV